MGGVGDEHLAAVRLPLVAEVRGGDEQRGELALGPGRRLERDGRQPGDFGEELLHLVEELQHALGGGVVLERVEVGKPAQPGEPLVPLRVVLHGARPERVEVGVDRHVPGGQVRVMPHEVDLADLRQRGRRVREVLPRDEFAERPGRHVGGRQLVAPPPGPREFKDEFGGLRVVHNSTE